MEWYLHGDISQYRATKIWRDWPVLLKFLVQTKCETLVMVYSGRLMLSFISTDSASVLQWNTRSSVVYASVSFATDKNLICYLGKTLRTSKHTGSALRLTQDWIYVASGNNKFSYRRETARFSKLFRISLHISHKNFPKVTLQRYILSLGPIHFPVNILVFSFWRWITLNDIKQTVNDSSTHRLYELLSSE